MNKERLLKLAEFLETNPQIEGHFDLAVWRKAINLDPAKNLVTDEQLHSCGTSACAVGWACSMPEFQAKGLGFGTRHGEYGSYDNEPTFTPEGSEQLSGWEAVETFFGLDGYSNKQSRTGDQSAMLFMSGFYPPSVGPTEVAERIRLFVANPEEAADDARIWEHKNNSRD